MRQVSQMVVYATRLRHEVIRHGIYPRLLLSLTIHCVSPPSLYLIQENRLTTRPHCCEPCRLWIKQEQPWLVILIRMYNM